MACIYLEQYCQSSVLLEQHVNDFLNMNLESERKPNLSWHPSPWQTPQWKKTQSFINRYVDIDSKWRILNKF